MTLLAKVQASQYSLVNDQLESDQVPKQMTTSLIITQYVKSLTERSSLGFICGQQALNVCK